MKKHVTVKQIGEIKALILECLLMKNITSYKSDEDIAKEFTIGRMIEILGENIWVLSQHREQNNEWIVGLYFDNEKFYSDEPCDALWDALKHVVEKDLEKGDKKIKKLTIKSCDVRR